MDALIDLLAKYWPEAVATITLGVMAVFYKKAIGWISTVFTHLAIKTKTAMAIHVTCPVPGIQESLKAIQLELHPNGGSSLRDAVNRIDANVNQVFNSVTALQADTDIQSDVLGLAMFKADIEGNIIYANRSFKTLFGFTEEEAYGNGWVNHLDENDKDKIYKAWKTAVAQRREYHTEHYITNPIKDERIYVSAYSKPVYNAKTNSFVGWTGIVREDIPPEEES